jgi:hypothetical protein
MPDFLTRVLQWFNSQPDINRMGFLSSFFKTSPESFVDVDECEIDIVRSGEEIAPVVQNLNTGAVTIVEDAFTTKKIPFPVYSLEKPVNITELMGRFPGENAYLTDRADWMGRLARPLVSGFAKMTNMIRRSIEVQSAQVLQHGTITLTDEKGRPAWILDLKPKASHFPTVVNDWGMPGADPEDDIAALAETIQADGQVDVLNLVMDNQALKNFLADEKVQRDIKQDGYRLGALNPRLVGKGAKYYGYIHIGSYQFDIWVYNANYNPFGSTEMNKYLEPNTVLFLPDTEDLDFRRLFGGIPMVRPDTSLDQIFGATKVTIGNEYDFRPRVRYDDKAETYFGEIKSRPLCLPVSIDRYGALKTKQPEAAG